MPYGPQAALVECLTPEIWTTPRRQSIKEKRVEDFSVAALDDSGRPLECFPPMHGRRFTGGGAGGDGPPQCLTWGDGAADIPPPQYFRNM